MAKDIENGLDKLQRHSSISKQIDQQSKQWKEFKNKIDSILLSNKNMNSNELRLKCVELDVMNTEQRKTFIMQNWGPLYLNKAFPLIQQLEMLENQINKANEERT